MKAKAKVIPLGNTTVVNQPDKGLTVHLSQNAHDASVNRLFKSKRFKRLPKGREVVKEGSVVMLVSKKLQYVPYGEKFMFPVILEGDTKISYFKCTKVSNYQVKVVDYGRVFECVPDVEVLVNKYHNYSFTQKTSNMATAKKAAPKKSAAKSKGKKPTSKKKEGPGKIEQIIALHKQGLSNKEIEAKGFNYTTISIQVAKYKKAHGKGKKK